MRETGAVAVLMGGPSAEHEISLKSGWGVVEALTRRRWIAEPVVVPRAISLPDARAFVQSALQKLSADVAFIALHGTFGEDGTIQALCDELHLAYTGSDRPASRLGIDKVASRERFEEVGLRVPRWRIVDGAAFKTASGLGCERNGQDLLAASVKTHDRLGLRESGFSYPLVVKPISQGSSIGVSIVEREVDLPKAIEEALPYGPQLLIEEFIAGRELTVGVLGEEPLPVVEIRPHQAFFDYTAKYTSGSTDYLVPAPLPRDRVPIVQAAGLAAHRALGCRHFSRTDLILDEAQRPVVLEVNTIPGFTPTSLLPKAAASIGISYEDLCERLVIMAVRSALQIVGSG